MTKSVSVRDIENKYGINLSTCTRAQLDALTSNHSKYKVIEKYDDLLLNHRQFDIANMTDIERANLKYLVMSTDEMLDIIKRKSKSIYYKPCEARLRWLISYNDFYQICAYKLLLNDGILRFNGNYKLEPAIHCWFMRVAMWQTHRKVSVADEVTILDKPCSSESDTTIGDLMLKDIECDLDLNGLDSNYRVSYILSKMDKTQSSHILLKAGDCSIPMSEYAIAKLFLVHKLGKKELSRMMYNAKNGKLVSNQIFNKFYKNALSHIAELLNGELSDAGESFTLDDENL